MRTEAPIVVEVTLVDGRPPVTLAVELSTADSRREEYVRGRRLLRRLIREVLGTGDVDIAVTARDAPRLVGSPAGVSISHTARYTAAAVWPGGPVGVDVEEPPSLLDDRLVRRCCGPWAPHVMELPEPDRAAAFARVWTVQEACVKALGLGLAGAPWRIPVDPFTRRGHWRRLSWSREPTIAPAALAVAVDSSQ